MIHFLPSFHQNNYLRTFAAEIDVLTTDELFLRGTMQDQKFLVEHTWKLRTPMYEILEASAQQQTGAGDIFHPELCERYEKIKGVKIGRGFTRHILQALGDVPGTQEHLFCAIEMARAGQQVYQFPAEFESSFTAQPMTSASNAHAVWLKDRAYMSDLKNSCHSYNDESEKLFSEREIHCSFDSSITRPQPGAKRVFWRNKRVQISKNSDHSWTCESAMEDVVHDILIRFTMDSEGVISNAYSRGLRLPYVGLCEDPQARTATLNGLRVTNDYVKEFATQVGGASGCTHLFDLSMDCLRLFRFEN